MHRAPPAASEHVELQVYCQACAPRFSTKGDHSTRAVTTPVLGLLSLMLVSVLAALAYALG